MPIEALWAMVMPEPFTVCPKCGAMPFESFLRGQVARSSWYWHRWWFRRRADIWCVICRACKDIVGHENIEQRGYQGDDTVSAKGEPMKVYTDDVDTFVAADMADLKAAWCEHHGDPTGEYWEPDSWEEVPGDKPLTIWANAMGIPDEPHTAGNAKLTKPASEWAAQQGKRGMLCSTEF